MTTQLKRIGIFSGGGDCPGLNAVIRAVTKTAIGKYNLEVVGIYDGFLGLIENNIRSLTYEDVSDILNRGGTILGANNKIDPAHYCVGYDDRNEPVYRNVADRVMQNVAAHQLDAVIGLGGDGTMSGAAHLVQHGLRFVGAPKTIDNDLMGTEVTFGFHTAVEIAADALDRIRTTASSHSRVMLVEMMGRNAGWLTLCAGMASGADVILIPEIPYDIETVVNCCLRRSRKGRAYTLIAVAEGAAPRGGQAVVRDRVEDSADPVRFGGVSQILAQQISERSGLECRATVLGHVQRGGTPCPYDRVLATQFGHFAMELAVAGQFGRMVAMQNARLTSIPLSEVAGRQRIIPTDHPMIATCQAVGTSFGDDR